ncbi:MAG: PfkB family carbohydrate kinase [Psychrobacillus psychrotolerans]
MIYFKKSCNTLKLQCSFFCIKKAHQKIGGQKFVLIYGDAFVDYIAEDQSNSRFTKFLGGATVNVAAGVARLGAAASFITVTGENETSEFVRNELVEEGVDLSFSQIVPEKEVSGVYVHLLENNERHFERYVDATPDIQVDFSSIKNEIIHETSVFHFCSGTYSSWDN